MELLEAQTITFTSSQEERTITSFADVEDVIAVICFSPQTSGFMSRPRLFNSLLNEKESDCHVQLR